MPYETAPTVLAWFETTLADSRPMIRRRALELLEWVDCAAREAWLDAAERDPDARVSATAVLIRAIVVSAADTDALDLLESDFGEAVIGEDASQDATSRELSWEWEYTVKVCEDHFVPSAAYLVWTRAEDDTAARELALIKARAGGDSLKELVPVIVGKRLVNRYTRSARSSIEAQRWHAEGRPRYQDG